MYEKRLRWQIYPSYLVLLLVVSGSVSLLAVHHLSGIVLLQTERELLIRAHLIARTLDYDWWNQDSVRQDVLRNLIIDDDIRITLIAADGSVKGDSVLDPQNMENHAARPEIRQAVSEGQGSARRLSSSLQDDMLYVAIKVATDEGPATIRTARRLDKLSAFSRALRFQVLALALLVAGLASALAWRLGRKLSRPIEELEKRAESFAKGDFDEAASQYSTREYNALSKSMNGMARQLRDRIDRVITQRNMFRAVLDGMAEGVVGVNNDLCIVTLNQAAAQILSVNFDEAAGQSIHDVIRSPDLVEFMQAALAKGEVGEHEVMAFHPEEQRIRVITSRLSGPDGTVTGVLAVLNDVTRVHKLENIRREFVANVSHELKTPITTIKGYIETLLDGALESEPDGRRFLGIIEKHTDRMNAIVQDLLSLSRLEQVATGMEQEPLDLVLVVKQAIAFCQSRAEQRQCSVMVRGVESCAMKGDPALLEHAVINLVDNAIKYGKSGKEVHVVIERDDKSVAIRVIDQGDGIASEHLSRIFERFYRVDKARSARTGGTGLGLAIVKHVAQVHGGVAQVQSVLGKGTTFEIRIPVDGGLGAGQVS